MFVISANLLLFYFTFRVGKENNITYADLIESYTIFNKRGNFSIRVPNIQRQMDYQVFISLKDGLDEKCCYREYLNITADNVEIVPGKANRAAVLYIILIIHAENP